MIKYKGDFELDREALAKSLDDSILRMEKEIDGLDCTEAEKAKFRKDVAKLKAKRGLP